MGDTKVKKAHRYLFIILFSLAVLILFSAPIPAQTQDPTAISTRAQTQTQNAANRIATATQKSANSLATRIILGATSTQIKTDKLATAAFIANDKLLCPQPSLTCTKMTSCEQAYACLRRGNKRLDRDKDGVPCETICPGG